MDTHSVVWGLDIGHTSVKAVKLGRAGDGVAVLGYAIEEIQIGEDVDRDDAVVAALTSLAASEDMRGVPVVAGLSGRQIFSRTINVPVLNEKKVDKMVELEARQQIPGDFDEVRWGYHMTPSVDGMSRDVALFAAKQEIISDLIDKCDRAGVVLSGISVTSLAAYNFIAYDQHFEADESVIVLDVGAENTDLVVYQGDSLWMRTLGVSGNDITRAFMKKFKVSFEEAETLKKQVADSRQAERILKVIEGNLTELSSEIQRSLGFYKSQNNDARFENVVVSGNTFKLPGLLQFMADRLGYAIITLEDLEEIEVDDNLDRDHFLEDLQSLGVAMGLGLQGLGVSKANVNLLPSSLRLQTLLNTKRWAAIAILVMLPLAFVATFLVSQSRMDSYHQLQERIERESDAFRAESKEAHDMAQQVPAVASATKRYAHFGEHIGVLQAVQAGVLEVIGEVALDREEYVLENRIPSSAPEAIHQAVFLDNLVIPSLNLAGGEDPFRALAVSREVRVRVRIPEWAERTKVKEAIRRGLDGLRWTPEMWAAHHPSDRPGGAPVTAPDELPQLFSSVSSTPGNRATDQYQFSDPFALVGDNQQGVEKTREFNVDVVEYNCTLGGGIAP